MEAYGARSGSYLSSNKDLSTGCRRRPIMRSLANVYVHAAGSSSFLLMVALCSEPERCICGRSRDCTDGPRLEAHLSSLVHKCKRARCQQKSVSFATGFMLKLMIGGRLRMQADLDARSAIESRNDRSSGWVGTY